MKDFCYQLQLPFELDTTWLQQQQSLITGSRTINIKIPNEHVDANLIAWTQVVGIRLLQAELIYTPAGGFQKIHIDLGVKSDQCKINWIYNGHDSVMQWFTEKPGAQARFLDRPEVGACVTTYQFEDMDMIHSECVQGPVLVLVGEPHCVLNPKNQPRWCITTTYIDPDTNQLLTFERAKEKLKNFLL